MLGVREAKRAMRREIGERLRALGEGVLRERSERLLAVLVESNEYAGARTIAAYLSIGGEMDMQPFVERILGDGKRLFLPQCGPNSTMRMLEVHSLEDVASLEPKGRYALREPEVVDGDGRAREDDETVSGGIDLVVMPGVAFDEAGGRLGRGMGFYDRWLARMADLGRRPQTMALALEEQRVASVPRSDDDVLMDRVVFA